MFTKDKGAFAARRKKKDEEDDKKSDGDGNATSSSSTVPTTASGTKMTSALLRVQKDLAELELPSSVTMKKEDDYTYAFMIKVTEGFWSGGEFEFKCVYPKQYPFGGPKVTCIDKIYHPNIDLEGGVCVNVLRPWKPTYNTQHILFGLLFLFSDPNATDPLNNDAAKDMRENKTQFSKNVVTALKGGRVGAVQFPKNRGC